MFQIHLLALFKVSIWTYLEWTARESGSSGQYLLHSPLCCPLLLTPAYVIAKAILSLLPILDVMILQSLFSIKYVILHLSPKTSVKNMLCTELTPDKIIVVRYRKIKSLFCKSCCELHNAASILILLDTLANYGSLCLLLSLLILLIRAFLAGWGGHCSHHARCCMHGLLFLSQKFCPDRMEDEKWHLKCWCSDGSYIFVCSSEVFHSLEVHMPAIIL